MDTNHLQQIENQFIAGNKKDAFELIDQYGTDKFWEDYKEFLFMHNLAINANYQKFTTLTISYFKIKSTLAEYSKNSEINIAGLYSEKLIEFWTQDYQTSFTNNAKGDLNAKYEIGNTILIKSNDVMRYFFILSGYNSKGDRLWKCTVAKRK